MDTLQKRIAQNQSRKANNKELIDAFIGVITIALFIGVMVVMMTIAY